MESRIGELAALGTAICWTITALSFESAGRRIGSLVVNIVRLVMAAALFALYGWAVRGMAIPLDLPSTAWVWLGLSGLVGFVIGDLLLFQAFVDIGARVSMLIYASVPPLTAVLGLIVLDETLGVLGIAGMVLTVTGITIVVAKRASEAHAPTRKRARGVLFAFGGALGQAGGLILGRLGAGRTFDAFAATQIRVLAAIAGFALVFTLSRRWRTVAPAIRDAGAMARVGLGAVFGPFLGVSLGLFAAQNSTAAVASTIMALVPVLIIAPAVMLFRERITMREVAGAIVAVSGVAMLFW